MSKILVVNDVHLGVNRVGGTTQQSVSELREFGHSQFKKLLETASNSGVFRVIINGDLADQYNLPLSEALEIYSTVCEWFDEGNPYTMLTLVAGNHDLSKDSSKLGTVEFVGALLKMKYPERFNLVTKPEAFGNIFIIPHVPNQDLFEQALASVPEGTKYLLLHCNWDNKFAADAEHSLNLDRAQAKALAARGITLVLGHEHQGRDSMMGKVLVVGNQFPSSVSDCLGNTVKRAMLIEPEGHRFIETWNAEQNADGWFARIDWKELDDVSEEGRGFIRVEGEATAEEAAEVIRAISAFRQRSKSFVVTNAVKVETLDDLDSLTESIEDVRSVDVLELLLEHLDPAQQEAIRKLTGEAV